MGTSKAIGFYKIEHTALSVSMRLMDDCPYIKLSRKENDNSNPGFPKNIYPFMLILENNIIKIEECRKINSEHFGRMKFDKNYKMKYDLSKSYYRSY